MSKRTGWIIAALVAVPVFVAFAQRNWSRIDAAYQDWRYPAPQSPAVGPLGEEILRQQDTSDMNKFLREYQRIQGLVDSAREHGVDVGVATGRLKDSTILARQGAFREATSMLNIAEMGLPKSRQNLRPAPSGGGDDAEGSAIIEGRPVAPVRR